MIRIITTYNLGHNKGILCTFQSKNIIPGFTDHLLSSSYSTRFIKLVNIANKQNCKLIKRLMLCWKQRRLAQMIKRKNNSYGN